MKSTFGRSHQRRAGIAPNNARPDAFPKRSRNCWSALSSNAHSDRAAMCVSAQTRRGQTGILNAGSARGLSRRCASISPAHAKCRAFKPVESQIVMLRRNNDLKVLAVVTSNSAARRNVQ